MKKAITILFVLITGATFAGKGLVVNQKYSTGVDGQNVSVTWYVTETQCKLSMRFSDKDVNTVSYFIPELKSGKLLTYNDGPSPAGTPKVYYSIPVGNIKAETATSTVERTGETKVISGMNCEKMVSKGAGSTTEMWVTKDFKADYYRFASFFKSSYELKALSASSIKGFPLSSVTKDNSGKVINEYELISVSSSELAETEFKVPAEYTSAEEVSKAKK